MGDVCGWWLWLWASINGLAEVNMVIRYICIEYSNPAKCTSSDVPLFSQCFSPSKQKYISFLGVTIYIHTYHNILCAWTAVRVHWFRDWLLVFYAQANSQRGLSCWNRLEQMNNTWTLLPHKNEPHVKIW